ncbi:MAG: ROK family transcriptional regulator [Lachnospiraceae bacterium]|nr:ROK family transcriptional regulator [Lachnospiraceae bacterium]
MKYSGMNMEQVKRRNRAAILNYINETGPVSRKDIATATGLTPAAVTQICSVLMEEHILEELGRAHSEGVGRKKVLVNINYDHTYLYAINMEPDGVKIALSNLKGDAVAKTLYSFDDQKSPRETLGEIAREAKKLGAGHRNLPIGGVSVAISGIVDKKKGLSVHAYGIWDEQVKVCEILESEFDLPVIIENNVNALAVAELLYGFGRQIDNILLIKWGPGVGSSMILKKELYEGTDRKAAELGHYIVEKDGAKCSCGRRGCLETKVSYPALCRIRPFAYDEFGVALAESEELKDALDLFARCIVNTVTIVSPNRVILCGSLFRSESVRRELIDACKKYDAAIDEERVSYTDLSDREDYIGPVATFLDHVIRFS